MKYLKYHKDYKLENLKSDFESSEMIREVFENDITWGGSLLGRLINSAIRVFKIGFNYTRINGLIKGVKEELDALLNEVYEKENADNKNKVDYIKFKMALAEIYKVVISNNTVEVKLKKLIGDEPLIDNTISIVEKSTMENKEVLIDKLKKFKEELMKLGKEAGLEGDEDKEGQAEEEVPSEKENPVVIFYNGSKSLLSSIVKIHYDIKNNAVKFQKGTTDGSVSGEEKTSTFFDDKKYQQQRDNTSDEIRKKIEMAKNAISIYTGKKNTLKKDKDGKVIERDPGYQERINFYNNEVKKYEAKLKGLLGKTQQSRTTTQLKHSYDLNADKRAKEELKKMHQPKPVNASYKYLTEEIDANLRDQEGHAKTAWSKVVNAYSKSGISKYISYIESLLNPTGVENIKESKKKILEIGRQVVINHSNIGNPISYDELIKEAEGPSVMDVSKSISLFSKVLLAFSSDMGLLGSYGASYKSGGDDAGGAGNHIKTFINSFNQIKGAYPSLKKESLLVSYSSFVMIKEAEEAPEEKDNRSLDDEDTETEETTTNKEPQAEVEERDKVKKAWYMFFKKGEEKEWKVTEEDSKFRDEFEKDMTEKEKVLEDASNDDHIIKIVNLFGRAYKLYATDWIPSGRPGGRVSQRTLREYEHIGRENPSVSSGSADSVIPGYGPWAAKLPYNKWQDGITKILEDKEYRRVLANIKFASKAETTTGTTMKAPGSGKTLFSFINDMLNNTEGDFKKHRHVIFNKYFGVDDKTLPKYDKVEGKNEPIRSSEISKEDEGETDKPFFSNKINLKTGFAGKEKTFIKIVTKQGEVVLVYPVKYNEKEKYVLFKYQTSKKSDPKQSIASNYLKDEKNNIGETYKMDFLEDEKQDGIPYFEGSYTYVGFSKDINEFRVGKKFDFKYMDKNSVDLTKYDMKESSFEILDIYYLVAPKVVKNKKGEDKQKIEIVNVKTANPERNDINVNNKVNDIIKKFQSK